MPTNYQTSKSLLLVILLLIVVLSIKKIIPVTDSEIDDHNNKILDGLNDFASVRYRDFIDTVYHLTGWKVYLTSGTRTLTEQQIFDILGIGAASGFSFHNYGLAIDLNLVKDGTWIKKASSAQEWESTGVPNIARNMFLLRWGGDFNTPDRVHFDLGRFFDTSELFAYAQNNPQTPIEKIPDYVNPQTV